MDRLSHIVGVVAEWAVRIFVYASYAAMLIFFLILLIGPMIEEWRDKRKHRGGGGPKNPYAGS